MSQGNIPRILVTVVNGMAQVRAVEGQVDVVMVDFDREGEDPMSEDEISALFAADRHGGGGAGEFDAAMETERDAFASRHGIQPGMRPG